MRQSKNKKISHFATLLFAVAFLLTSASMHAQGTATTTCSENTVEGVPEGNSADAPKKELNLKEIIFGHINDAYSWHITTLGDTHVTIPLLCIVYGQNGLDVFCASKLGHEGHYVEYKGYKIAESGTPNEGRIIEVATGERPWDFSITKNVLSLFMSCALILFIFLTIAKKYKENPRTRPTGLQAILEPLIVTLHDDIIKPSVGKNYKKFSAYLLTAFFFIFINNVLGIVPIFPGGANLTGNIAITFALAGITFILTNVCGTKEYWKEIFWPDVPVWLKAPVPIMQFVEVIGIFTKPIALCIRLFANMFAGHVMVLVLIGLIFIFNDKAGIIAAGGISVVSVFLVIFMSLLECLVCFIQAYVFMTLSALFIGMGQVEGHEK